MSLLYVRSSNELALRSQTRPDRIGFFGFQSHPKRIGIDRGNPGFLGTYKRILRVKIPKKNVRCGQDLWLWIFFGELFGGYLTVGWISEEWSDWI